MARVLSNVIALKLCEALGIGSDNVYQITIDLTAGNIGVVTVVRYLTNERGDRFVEKIADEYELKPIDNGS